jgi:hypothetical protein
MTGGPPIAFIAAKLDATDIYQSAAVAHANTHKDIDRGNILATATVTDSKPIRAADVAMSTNAGESTLLKSLGSVVSKLDILVKIMDKTSKVFSVCFVLYISADSELKGSSICRSRLGCHVLPVQGKIPFLRALPSPTLSLSAGRQGAV